jgi:hypothetical protein
MRSVSKLQEQDVECNQLKAGLKNVSEEFQFCKNDWKRLNAFNVKKCDAEIEKLIMAQKTLETLRSEQT